MSDRKRQKTHQYYNNKPRNKLFLEAGVRGFFCTCNFREKDCVKEAYNLLNEYANQLYGLEDTKNNADNEMPTTDETDISEQLQKEIQSLKDQKKRDIKERRFQAVDTGAANCIFIRTSLEKPEDIAQKIFEDISVTKSQKTRFLLRLYPIMATCKANIPDIIKTAGELFDQFFLKDSSTFAIIYNKRYNNSVPRDDVIKELADLISLKNINNKADLKKPQLAVIVEIVKGICLLSVLPNYFEYKKYNLIEICKTEDKTETSSEIVDQYYETEEQSKTEGKEETPKALRDPNKDETIAT